MAEDVIKARNRNRRHEGVAGEGGEVARIVGPTQAPSSGMS